MKNKEKFAKEIIEIECTGQSIAVDEVGDIVACNSEQCERCIFSGMDCGKEIQEWAEKEYEEPRIQPEVKNCKVDDKILVSNNGKDWISAHFAKYDNICGVVLSYYNGCTSWTTDMRTAWRYVKLPESEAQKAVIE